MEALFFSSCHPHCKYFLTGLVLLVNFQFLLTTHPSLSYTDYSSKTKVMVLQVFACVQTHQIMHIKYVWFLIHELSLSKSLNKQTKASVCHSFLKNVNDIPCLPFCPQKYLRSSLRHSWPTNTSNSLFILSSHGIIYAHTQYYPHAVLFICVSSKIVWIFCLSTFVKAFIMCPPLHSLLSQLYYLPNKFFFILRICEVSASTVFSKIPYKLKECSKIETDQKGIKIHLCSMTHENYVLNCAQWLVNICEIE